MAKYSVNFSCGHVETKQLFGKCSERERTISYWEQSGICSDCYKAQQDAKRAAVAAACNTLPSLTGSAKQIDWATKIRADKYAMFKGIRFDYIKSETSAAWWIDNRNDAESVIVARANAAQKQSKVAKVLAMTKSDIFKQAHVLAKQLKTQYPDTSYQANFSESLKALYAAIKSIKLAA